MNVAETEKKILSDYFGRLPSPNEYPHTDYLIPVRQKLIPSKRVDFSPSKSIEIETLRFVKIRFADVGFFWTIKSFFFDYTYVDVFGKIETI